MIKKSLLFSGYVFCLIGILLLISGFVTFGDEQVEMFL